MGFLDALLGGRRKLKTPAPDRLFAMTTANITLDTGLGLKHRGRAGIVFQPLGTADFQQIVKETEELLAGTAADTGTKIKTHDDEYGYRWLVLEDPDFDDLVVAINTVSSQLESAGYGDRVLAAVFAFEENGKPLYFIYNFKRGAYYPFVPAKASRPATPSASCASSPSSEPSCHGKTTWPAGSRSGTSRCRAKQLLPPPVAAPTGAVTARFACRGPRARPRARAPQRCCSSPTRLALCRRSVRSPQARHGPARR